MDGEKERQEWAAPQGQAAESSSQGAEQAARLADRMVAKVYKKIGLLQL